MQKLYHWRNLLGKFITEGVLRDQHQTLEDLNPQKKRPKDLQWNESDGVWPIMCADGQTPS